MIRATTSASNMDRRAACPGSERLEEGLPEEDSDQSREGTLLHKLYANPVLDRAQLTPDQRDLLNISAELEEQVFERVVIQFAIAPGEPFTQGHEQDLWVHKGIKALIPGHCDRWRHYHRLKLLIVLDEKFGYKEVTPAAANYQLRTYACGGAELWPVENVVVAITQPRLPYDQRITMAAYTAGDIKAARLELFAIKAECAKPEAQLLAGEEQCRYCKAKMICPAFTGSLKQLATLPGTDLATVGSALARCTDDELDLFLQIVQRADFVKEQLRDEARARVASGKLPTWTLGKATKVREVTDPERAIALLTTSGTLSTTDVLACSTPSLKKLETKLREKTGGTWKDARDKIDSTLAGVLEFSEKKPSLVRVKV